MWRSPTGQDVLPVDTGVFLDEVLPALLTEGPRVELWFEAATLQIRHEQVRTIAAAGGEIQIGIESLSDGTCSSSCARALGRWKACGC